MKMFGLGLGGTQDGASPLDALREAATVLQAVGECLTRIEAHLASIDRATAAREDREPCRYCAAPASVRELREVAHGD